MVTRNDLVNLRGNTQLQFGAQLVPRVFSIPYLSANAVYREVKSGGAFVAFRVSIGATPVLGMVTNSGLLNLGPGSNPSRARNFCQICSMSSRRDGRFLSGMATVRDLAR